MVMVSALGAASAQAAPSLHCEATPLRATIAGTQSVEPVTQGRNAACADGEAVPSLPANPLLSASVLTAKTTFDAATPAGAATGGVADLQVLPTPDLIAQLPTEQAIAALDNVQVKPLLDPILGPILALAGVPGLLNLDLSDAVRALVPAPGTALLSASLLEARAGVTCAAGVPSLAGSSTLTGVRLLGGDVGVDSTVSQALTVMQGGTINPAALNPMLVKVLTPLATTPLKAVTDNLAAILATIPPITLPASVIDARLVPNEQTRDGNTLTQRALHASLSLGGQPVLDAVFGEAKVGADDGACPRPAAAAPAPVTPSSKAPAKTAPAAGQSVADQILACSDRKLVLVDVLKEGDHVKLLGAANRAYVGRKVAIRLRRGNKVVAHAVVRKDGSFQTTAPMPPRAVMASHTKANTLRYRAEIGKELSLPLKLQRRLIVNSLTSKGGKVTISGRVVRPLTTPVSTIRLVRRVSCHKVVLVKRFKPNADGTFRVTVKAPKGQAAAVYRLASYVREKASNPRKYPTFTLPRGVALSTR
jgi:hypothetical protein